MAFLDRLTSRGGVLQDLRYAWRQLRRAPGFASVAILTLALGIGGSIAFASLARALAFAPIPVARVDGLFAVTSVNRRTGEIAASLPLSRFRDLEQQPPPSAAAVAADAGTWIATLQTPDAIEQVAVGAVTGNYARVLDLPTQAGRWIGPDDDLAGAAPVVVVSDRLWRAWFAGHQDAIGRVSVKVNATSFTVIGVAPREFRGLRTNLAQPDAWIPVRTAAGVFTEAPTVGLGLVRPRPGVTMSQCEGEVRAAYGEWRSAWDVIGLTPATAVLRDSTTTASGWMVLSLSLLVWLASCANLANMLYARGTQRAGETAVRLSLGASPLRVLRLFLAEMAIIAVLAGIAGLGLAAGAVRMFVIAVPELGGHRTIPHLVPDTRLLFSALGVAALSAILVGLATARRSSRVSPLQVLASSGAQPGMTPRGSARRTALVAVQITVAVMLVMGAGLYVERYRQARTRNAVEDRDRFDAAHLATARINLRLLDYTVPQGLHFFERLVGDVRRLPGAQAAAIASALPTSQPGTNWTSVTIEPPGGVTADMANLRGSRGLRWLALAPLYVSASYFETLGVPVRRQPGFSTWDAVDGPPVAVISESAAAALWPGEDPMGRRLMTPHPDFARARMAYDVVTVVGVSADPVERSATSPAWAPHVVFRPFAPWWGEANRPDMLVVMRAPQPAAQIEPLQRAIRAIDPAVALLAASTRDDYVRAQFGVTRALDALMAALGALAFAIATIGVYGVIAYFVSTRTREFGIRLALGATPQRVVKLVLDYAVHIVLVGLLPGVFVVSVASRLIQSQVLNLMPNDITTWIAVPLLILAAGLLAGYVPARRAARVDPNVALREL